MSNIAYGKGPKDSNIPAASQSPESLLMSDSIIKMNVGCTNLPKLDYYSDSDPMVVMLIPDKIKGGYVEVDRTEIIQNTENPTFVHFFQALYRFETQQPLRFEIYDSDSNSNSLSHQEYIGKVDTDVFTIISNLQAKQEFKIESKYNEDSKLIIVAEQHIESKEVVEMLISVKDLKRMRTFSRNRPFFTITKANESGVEIPVYRSEVVPKCVSCTFNRFIVPLNAFCDGNLDTPMTIKVSDYHNFDPAKDIGAFQASVKDLLEKKTYELQPTKPVPNSANKNSENKSKKKKDTLGSVTIMEMRVRKQPNFLNYLEGGLKIKLITAVDFTGSNGNPKEYGSTHYIGSTPNQYQQSIQRVGQILCPYDSDQKFTVFGFGGVYKGFTSDCFPLNGNKEKPEVYSLEEILDVYKHSILKYDLSGPTNFAKIIKKSIEISERNWKESKSYTILLIMTDGIISDFKATADLIVKGSELPLSIIIVGV
ncbi:Copine family protein [Trichomonas vaginalis G3]|uniref:Copine family protein n=1 Tax=Trichomonas vaginalis (strain ATCC PRA-98 / G3) TaxID=412133 RepID=A2DXR2_TRIV3|nr:negative regulation of response to water deprivation [Trichomonas vaginalis G3]EAY14772.1 Copine family protein [Trichomonas vaginalis G3]KAI5508046.1 negative regulation of response to water deprivation [Trichomonas vaginalis G3]|eukprot:XP_001326995.1 Copine family protein [Trichomonas vaginalis G3]